MTATNERSQVPATSVTTWKIDQEASRVEFTTRMRLMFVMKVTVLGRFSDVAGTLTVDEREPTNSRVAVTIGLGDYLALSRAEQAAGAAANPGILADVCEALIAAIYLDGGFEAASEFVRRFWQPLIDEMEGPPRDPKTALQEWAQARALALPTYELVGTSGPDHALRFTVAAKVAGRDSAAATASSKRIAEARAAELLLGRLAAET